jgi:S1-C subfamily serine protease
VRILARLAIASVLLCFGASLCHASVVPGSPFTFNKWRGAAYTNDNGTFGSCVVSSMYVSGTTLIFVVQSNGSVSIGFARPNWTFQKGQVIPGDIKIDQRYSAHVTGVAVLPTTVRVDFLPSDAIFNHIAHGYVMTISSPAGNAVFELTDTYRALQMALECAQKYGSKFGVPPTVPLSLEAQKWLTRNPWFNDPRYADQARAALVISNQMNTEGKDQSSAAYWDEFDDRIHSAGLKIPAVTPRIPSATSLPPPPPPSRPAKTIEMSGTGFVVSTDGFIVTNHHVVGNCVSDVHGNLTGESVVNLRVVSTDEANVLALLKAPMTFKEPAIIRGPAIKPGDSIIAIGYPFYELLSSDFSVTSGIVSSLGGIGNDSRYLQMSAPIQPGNSGGPLLDTNGSVVGVVTEKLDAIKVAKITGSIPENINFAIKTGALRDFLDKNVVNYQTSASSTDMKISDIASVARAYILRISCTANEAD